MRPSKRTVGLFRLLILLLKSQASRLFAVRRKGYADGTGKNEHVSTACYSDLTNATRASPTAAIAALTVKAYW